MSGARTWAATAVRLVLAAVWAASALSTVGDPAATVRAVEAYRLLPGWLARGVGYGLPFLAAALAVLLLAGLATRAAAAVSAVLFALLLAGIVSAAARGLDIDGGWLGGRAPGHPAEIAPDAVLLLLAAALARWPLTQCAADDAVRAAAVAGLPEERVGPRRTAEARRRLAEVTARREAAAARRSRAAAALAGVLLVLATGVGVGVQAARDSGGGPAAQPVALDTGVAVGRSGARATLELYVDPACPGCARLTAESGPRIRQWVQAGTVRVRYHVVSFLDARSTTKYSSRAANALYCSADAGVFPDYSDLLFARQPADGSAGLSDEQLVAYAQQAGATDREKFATCLRDRKYGGLVSDISGRALKDGIDVSSGPVVLLDGKVLQPATLKTLDAAVRAAT